MSLVDVPHFSFPFTFQGKGVKVIDQDTADELMTCANVITRCPTGFRQARPDFGWSFPEFRTIPLDVSSLMNALQRFGPAGRFTAYEVADVVDASIRRITFEMRQVN